VPSVRLVLMSHRVGLARWRCGRRFTRKRKSPPRQKMAEWGTRFQISIDVNGPGHPSTSSRRSVARHRGLSLLGALRSSTTADSLRASSFDYAQDFSWGLTLTRAGANAAPAGDPDSGPQGASTSAERNWIFICSYPALKRRALSCCPYRLSVAATRLEPNFPPHPSVPPAVAGFTLG
jgi:hypothetical protein